MRSRLSGSEGCVDLTCKQNAKLVLAVWEGPELTSSHESEGRSVLSHSAIPWTIQSMEFSRPESWSG